MFLIICYLQDYNKVLIAPIAIASLLPIMS